MFQPGRWQRTFKEFAAKKIEKKRKAMAIAAAAAVFIGALGFISVNAGSRNVQMTAQQTQPPAPVPMPTAINENFNMAVNECLLPISKIYGYNLRITSGFRSLQEQEALYEQGRTVDGHIVTEAPPSKSIHNYGYAVDVVDRFNAFDVDWEKLGRIGAYCGLEQGPDGDLPHFEVRAGLSTADFASGKRPPLLSLPCSIMDQRYQAKQKLTLKDLQNCGAPKF